MHLRELIYKFTFLKHYPIVREEMAMTSFFGILFLIETMISDKNFTILISLSCKRVNGNVLII